MNKYPISRLIYSDVLILFPSNTANPNPARANSTTNGPQVILHSHYNNSLKLDNTKDVATNFLN